MAKLSKRGQGLGFIAIIVLVALLYFIFKYNVQTYEFVMTAGDEQAHLVTSFVETEKAKVFAGTALRQAAYEAAWNLGAKSCNFNQFCSNYTDFLGKTGSVFKNYTLMYEPTTMLLETDFPDYKLEMRSCSNTTVKIEAFGFSETCYLRPNFPFPKVPCEDQSNETSCKEVKLTTGGQACKWEFDKDLKEYDCAEMNPAPACDAITSQTGCTVNTNCIWETSYSEKINVLSAPLINYQFRIDSDAHFIETIDCKDYEAFIESRRVQ